MSRPSRRSATSVSLFPFLAVLICTMGALILLLLVTTRRIRTETLARGSAPVVAVEPEIVFRQPTAADEVALPAEEGLRQRAADLQRRRTELAARLAERRGELASRQEQVQSAQSVLIALEHQLQQVISEEQRLRQVLRELTTREEEAAAARAEVQRRIDQTRAQPPARSKYAVIPFDGRRGTTRRPIFIECTEQGLRFLAEDLLLQEEHLNGFTTDFNPLLAGTQALIGYYQQREGEGEGGFSSDRPEPYVLLIVRPGGAVAYYAARQLLRRLEGPLGYELLDEDWELSLETPDPAAREVVRRAVAQALSERAGVQRLVRSGKAGPQAGSATAAGAGDGTGAGKHDPAEGGSAWAERELLFPPERPIAAPQPHAGGPGSAQGAEQRAPDALARGSLESELQVVDAKDLRRTSDRGDGDVAAAAQVREAASAPAPFWTGGASESQAGRLPESLPETTASRAGDDRRSTGSSASRPLASSSAPDSLDFSNASGQRDDEFSPSTQRTWTAVKRGRGLGFERPVTVRVEADRLMIGKSQHIRTQPQQKQDELVQQVLEALDHECRAWGPAPEGFHWVPSVRFEVTAEGNYLYERLNGPLKRYGLTTSVKFLRADR